MVTRWLRLVGAPKKRGATSPMRPAALRLDQLRQRKPGAAVLGRGVDAVVADVRDAQVVLLRGVAVIDLVEFGAAIVLRARALVALGGIIGGGRGDDGDARLRQRLLQRLERRLEVVRPAIGRRVADRRVVVARALHVGDRRVVVRSEAELRVGRSRTLLLFFLRFLVESLGRADDRHLFLNRIFNGALAEAGP